MTEWSRRPEPSHLGPCQVHYVYWRHLDIRHGDLPAEREERLLFCLAFIVKMASTSRRPGVGNAIKWGPHKQPPPPPPTHTYTFNLLRDLWAVLGITGSQSTGSRTSIDLSSFLTLPPSDFMMCTCFHKSFLKLLTAQSGEQQESKRWRGEHAARTMMQLQQHITDIIYGGWWLLVIVYIHLYSGYWKLVFFSTERQAFVCSSEWMHSIKL